MKKIIISLLIIFSSILVFPIGVFASVNSGFIPGQIWYSKTTLTEGDTVNIHTAVWNGEKNSLSTKVQFYDKEMILGSRDVVVAPAELKDVYIPWKITSGDHIISAKITSSVLTVSGKKENVILSSTTTLPDRQFVAVVVKNAEGDKVSGDEGLLQKQIDKTASEIDSVVPESIRTPVLNVFTSLDKFRDNTYNTASKIKDETKKEIVTLTINNAVQQKSAENSNIQDSTKKPITYIKLFLFTIIAFILGNPIAFYAILLIIIFYILRAIYRLIQNR